MKYIFTIASLAILTGCGPTPGTDNPENDAQRPKLSKSNAAIVLDIGIPQKERTISLSERDTLWIKKVIDNPSRLETPSVPLEPNIAVIIDDTQYALEPDEIIQFTGTGSNHWSSPGVKKRLLDSVRNRDTNK